MPIYEFACPKCRVIFNFFSQRVKPERLPKCPRCGNKKMERQLSSFAMTRGLKDAATTTDSPEGGMDGMPDIDDPRVARVMDEMERDMSSLDENNPRHLAQMMRKMKEIMPPGTTPKELEVAIKRLESGEDPEKIEADMGDVLGDFMDEGQAPGGKEKSNKSKGKRAAQPKKFTRDKALYDY